jgi:hypothetical protein
MWNNLDGNLWGYFKLYFIMSNMDNLDASKGLPCVCSLIITEVVNFLENGIDLVAIIDHDD